MAAEYYVWTLTMDGARKSLEPMVARIGGTSVEYEALQHSLADSPWDPAVIDRAVAERVCAVIEPMAWVLDDLGSRSTAATRRGSSASTSGRWGRSGAARSRCRCML